MGAHNLAFSIHLPNTKLSMSLSHAETCIRQTRTPTYTCTIALQHIWIIKIKIQANTLIFYVGENIIIYTIIHMLLYVNLCRNMLRLNVIYSLWYSKMCSTAPLLREKTLSGEKLYWHQTSLHKVRILPRDHTLPKRNTRLDPWGSNDALGTVWIHFTFAKLLIL